MLSEKERQMQKLMDEWKASHQVKGKTKFVTDGFVDFDSYKKASPKICFFLKEAYLSKGEDGGELTDWLNKGLMTRMWNAAAEWTYGIRHTTETDIPAKPQLTKEEKTGLLRTVSVVNVKKSNGNSGSKYDDLLNFAQEDSDFLKRELDIIDPDVIVCGHNSSLLRLLYGATVNENNQVSPDGLIDEGFMRENGYAFLNGKILIDYYHPANHFPSILNYYTVCSLYQQALKMKD